MAPTKIHKNKKENYAKLEKQKLLVVKSCHGIRDVR